MREIMRRLAAYVMSGYLPAIGVVTFAALAALLLQPLTLVLAYLSGAALALVTLRRGWQSGVLVLAAALALTALLAGLMFGSGLPLAAANLAYWLPVWLAAVVLRRTVRLEQAVQAALIFGLSLVAFAYVGLGDPAGWWAGHLGELFRLIADQGGPDLSEHLAGLARWMTAVVVAGLVIGVLLGLLLGRWWQALLYNPGGFGEEFKALRLGAPPTLLAVGLMLLSQLLSGVGGQMAADGLLVVAVGFLLQGLAVLHALVWRRNRHVGWLVGLYALLLLATPQVAPLVALLGLVDNWFGFRERAAG